jgi:hypothetical protein
LLPRQIVGGLLESLDLLNVGIDRATPVHTTVLIGRDEQIFRKIHDERIAVTHYLQAVFRDILERSGTFRPQIGVFDLLDHPAGASHHRHPQTYSPESDNASRGPPSSLPSHFLP